MGKLLQFFRSRSLREMLQELDWLSRYSLHYKKEVLWYIFIGVLGTAVSLIGSILRGDYQSPAGRETRSLQLVYFSASLCYDKQKDGDGGARGILLSDHPIYYRVCTGCNIFLCSYQR